MLSFIKALIKPLIIPCLYIAGLVLAFLSMFKNVYWGLYFMTFFIPQPNLWHMFRAYWFGKDFLDILFLGILAGIFVQGLGFVKKRNTVIILLYIFIIYLALWNCALNFNLPLPITTDNTLLLDWKNFAQMIFLYFLALNIVKDERQQKILILVICASIFFISLRSYRNFTGGSAFHWDKRDGGPFNAVGLGANHYGAFISYYITFFLGLFFYDKNINRKKLYLATYLLGLHPLLFAYSRGAYLATLVGLSFFGLRKKILLVLIALIIAGYQVILPVSVVDRINMTKTSSGEFDKSAEHRLIMWEIAIDAFKQHPIFGVGFGGFGHIIPRDEKLTDTHNFYMKTLSEEGIIGIIILFCILIKAFRSGSLLFRIGKTDFQRGLGFGFMGCVLALMVANIFGDRFSYFCLGGFFWLLWGLVDRGILISQAGPVAEQAETTPAVPGKWDWLLK